ncbi:Flavonoid glucosyltransferase, family GT1 [Zostera marina]|uniref:Glycosyltransferase n=1 Tax=Zostera marina TaxID=29655 RepID=A0A0K9NK61_ZOSMR|nr:Flavonoid glucosyltransferase, family GT1 [Zostera marina]
MGSHQPQPPPPLHVAILPNPGMGHLIPLAEFAKLLTTNYGITVTFLTLDDSPRINSFIDALPDTITYIPLLKPSLHDLPPGSKAETYISLIMSRCLPSLREVMVKLKATTNLVALIVDLFGTDAFDVATDLEVSPYIMFPSTATLLNFMFHLEDLDRTIQGEYRDHPQLIRIPGCVPFHGKDLLVPVQDRNDQAYSLFLDISTRYKEAAGIFFNSASSIEPGPIKELMSMDRPPVYPIGPLVHDTNSEDDNSGCVKWLDERRPGSVLFVSFGSTGRLTAEQFTELAVGLEMSGYGFLWIARSPKETGEKGFFNVKSKSDPLLFLPDGFLERTKEIGLVVDSWAPQLAILKHAAIGGFLTHCGWNSSLESIVHSVPMIAWPLYAEQKMNATMLVEELKIAIRPVVDEKRGLIGREEISRVVREVIEGEEGKKLRLNVKRIAENAINENSYKSLDAVVNIWKNSTSI